MLRTLLVVLLSGAASVASAEPAKKIEVGSIADTSTKSTTERRANTDAARRAVARIEALGPSGEPCVIDLTIVKTSIQPAGSGRVIATAEVQVVVSDARGEMQSVASSTSTVEVPGSAARKQAARVDAIDAAVHSVLGKARGTVVAAQ